MRGRPDEIDQALVTLNDKVAAELSADGWSRRLVTDDPASVTLVRPAQNGVTTVVRIGRTSFRSPDDWPVEVKASLGVGYEPALNLMPLLTLDPRAILIRGVEHGRSNGGTVSLDGPDTSADAVRHIVDFVHRHAEAVTRNYPDVAAIDAQLQREIAAAVTSSAAENDDGDGDDDHGAADFYQQLRLVVLAAGGRHDEARALLAAYPAGRPDEPIDRDDRRFIRQLTRWLDAGGPVAPPVDDTLAELPRRARSPRPSWSTARVHSKAKKAALDAARAQAKGKSHGQLTDVIAAEYRARDIDVAPSVVDFTAKMLQREQQPFGRARAALMAIRMIKSGGGDVIRSFSQDAEDDPAWLRPPDRASYPMIAGRDRYTSIELDPEAQVVLDRVRTEAPRRVGFWALVDVWLARVDPAGPLVAHIGDQRVGTVRASDAPEFDRATRAAAMFDEDPFVEGRLTSGDGTVLAALEIPLPQRADAPAPT